jgi:putative zinc finger/helix-turn-helix YgiT family protein
MTMSDVRESENTCPNCNSARLEERQEKQEFAYGIGDEQVALKATLPVFVCPNCDFAFSDERGEIARHAAVCSHLGVLAPAEIVAIRRRLSLSRNEFAELTGVGIASLQRWETGSQIQSKSNDKLIRLMRNPENISLLKEDGGQSQTAAPGPLRSATSYHRTFRRESVFLRLKNRASLEAAAGSWSLRITRPKCI